MNDKVAATAVTPATATSPKPMEQRYLVCSKLFFIRTQFTEKSVKNEECAREEARKTCDINWYPHFCRKFTEIFQPPFEQTLS